MGNGSSAQTSASSSLPPSPTWTLRTDGSNERKNWRHSRTICWIGISKVKGMTYISLLLFKASKTFWYRRDLGVLASCKHTFPKDVSKPILVAGGDFTIVTPTTSPTRGLASEQLIESLPLRAATAPSYHWYKTSGASPIQSTSSCGSRSGCKGSGELYPPWNIWVKAVFFFSLVVELFQHHHFEGKSTGFVLKDTRLPSERKSSEVLWSSVANGTNKNIKPTQSNKKSISSLEAIYINNVIVFFSWVLFTII